MKPTLSACKNFIVEHPKTICGASFVVGVLVGAATVVSFLAHLQNKIWREIDMDEKAHN